MPLLRSSLNQFMLISVAAHAVTLGAAATHWSLNENPHPSVQHYASTISLGVMAASSGASAPQQNSVAAKPVEPIKSAPKALAEEITPPKHNQQPVFKPQAKEDSVTEQQKELTEKQTDSEESATPQPSAPEAQSSLQQGQQGVDGSVGEALVAETGEHQQIGAQNQAVSYDAEVLRQLMQHKRYPHRLRRYRLEGDVELTFTLDRQGQVVSADATLLDGHQYFTRAALQQLSMAEPFPSAPDDLPWEQRHYQVAIHYSVE